jgi:hypothetical protein
LKEGDALSPLLFTFALQYAIRRVQVIQDGLKFKWYTSAFGLCHLMLIRILGGSVHTIQENTEAWIVASKEIELEVQGYRNRWTGFETAIN